MKIRPILFLSVLAVTIAVMGAPHWESAKLPAADAIGNLPQLAVPPGQEVILPFDAARLSDIEIIYPETNQSFSEINSLFKKLLAAAPQRFLHPKYLPELRTTAKYIKFKRNIRAAFAITESGWLLQDLNNQITLIIKLPASYYSSLPRLLKNAPSLNPINFKLSNEKIIAKNAGKKLELHSVIIAKNGVAQIEAILEGGTVQSNTPIVPTVPGSVSNTPIVSSVPSKPPVLSPLPSALPTVAPTVAPTPAPTNPPSPSSTPQKTATPQPTPSKTNSNTATPVRTSTPTVSTSPSAQPTPDSSPTTSATATPCVEEEIFCGVRSTEIATDIQAGDAKRCECTDGNGRVVEHTGIDPDGSCMPPKSTDPEVGCKKDWLCPGESDIQAGPVIAVLQLNLKDITCPNDPYCAPSGDIRVESDWQSGGAPSLRDCTYRVVQDCEPVPKCPATPTPKR